MDDIPCLVQQHVSADKVISVRVFHFMALGWWETGRESTAGALQVLLS